MRGLLDRARRTVQRARVEPAALIDRVLEIAQPRLDRNHVAVAVNAAPQLPHIEADSAQLELALLNLITNAIDAMVEGGSLTVTLAPLDDGVRLEVADSGPGVPEALLPHHLRAVGHHRSPTDAAPASGWRSPAASSRPTAVRLVYRIGLTAAPSSPVDLPATHYVPTRRGCSGARGAACVSTDVQCAHAGSSAMPNILIVDDDRETSHVHDGAAVAAGSRDPDGARSDCCRRALVARRPFDLIVSDINLNARSSGLDLPSRVQDEPARGSGCADQRVRQRSRRAIEALRAGAFDYVSKPFNIGEIKATVERALAQAAHGDTRASAANRGSRRKGSSAAARRSARGLQADSAGRRVLQSRC